MHNICDIMSTSTWDQQVIMDGDQSSLIRPMFYLVLAKVLFLVWSFALSYLFNDLPQFVSHVTSVRLFADDRALFRKITNFNDHLLFYRET